MSKSSDKVAAAHSSLMALLESRVISPGTRQHVETVRETVEQELKEISGSTQRNGRQKRTANAPKPNLRNRSKS